MNNDAMLKEWKRRLEKGAACLESHPEVPEWLRKVVRDAIGVADDLAPQTDSRPDLDTHHYPH